MAQTYTNRLLSEASPYLQQHAHNPVDWYPWGDEVFVRARDEDKPIFLSIGYATCHWCHVMAHDSFEDTEVAGLLNDAFVCIKVDREERPEIDNIYMTVCQLMTGGGGWPLTIVMTPDRKPFFAATFIPKESAYGRVGMKDLIPRIKEAWQSKRAEVLQSSEQLTGILQDSQRQDGPTGAPESKATEAYDSLAKEYDSRHGGFGDKPKFPTPHRLIFLLRYWCRHQDSDALAMVEHTLQQMALGGVNDQVGFGFHRYSTDQEWLVPHFEKMLYDQALIAYAATEAFEATANPLYRSMAERILTYVKRDMTAAEGGFYSAEDADSEGEEGRFYVWTKQELLEVLGDEDGTFACQVFGVQDEGNFLEEATGRKTGMNILHLSFTPVQQAMAMGMELFAFETKLATIRKKLFCYREERVHPLKDTKILTDWNGLMIAAFAKAGRVFGSTEYLDVAAKAVDFILDRLGSEGGRLMHCYMSGQVSVVGQLSDYAAMTWGLLELYQATFKPRFLKTAMELTDVVLTHFADESNGGFYMTASDAESLLIRPKEFYDGAVPAGNSLMAMNLLLLARLTGEPRFDESFRKLQRVLGRQVVQSPANFTYYLLSDLFANPGSREVVVVGKSGGSDTKELLACLNSVYSPIKVVVFKAVDSGDADTVMELVPYTRTHDTVGGKATVYICENFSCRQPVTDPDEVRQLLQQ